VLHVFVLYFTFILFVFFAVTVCECHIEITGYLLTYLLFTARRTVHNIMTSSLSDTFVCLSRSPDSTIVV